MSLTVAQCSPLANLVICSPLTHPGSGGENVNMEVYKGPETGTARVPLGPLF